MSDWKRVIFARAKISSLIRYGTVPYRRIVSYCTVWYQYVILHTVLRTRQDKTRQVYMVKALVLEP